ncbi:hypothetical protein JCM19294_1428 [Nonlabens tegetincola]|uniref:Riboflavin synthase subunit beta n=1 Tax=Nonlabens tegetincola TaxID=323273 RepID=A0A090Q5C3_9FLAO|nr:MULTISPECIES: riboflavin synthase subunit beta [Nonlabens]ALM20398.1 riboflavin synthase subunit beta [Nonlabens sp. MIC269]GAK97382.1 hypothetical protein JCM19294_1428 [Nonlabens tegetincola]
MGILHRRKNKKYDYQPRYYKNEDGGRPFEIKGKFDEHRKTLQKTKGIKGKFQAAADDYSSGMDVAVKNRILIIIAVLVLLFLWFIDFDFSIFRF